MMYGNHMSAGGWVFSILRTLIILALIVAAIYSISSARNKSGRGRVLPTLSAREVLDGRVAVS